MANIAVILSAGSGSRFGGAVPKQFVKLAGKSVIEYTVEIFEKSKDIDEVIIVAQSPHIEKTWEIIKKNKWKKINKVILGGNERFDSTYSAIKALEEYDEKSKVLFHDAVRPLLTERIINDCLEVLDSFEAVDVVINSADTLVEVYDDGCIANIPNRSIMRRGQTPQGFLLGTIKKAYKKAIDTNRYVFTCDCGVVRAMLPQVRVATVSGSERNLKITQPIDLFVAEKLLQAGDKSDYRSPEKLTLLKNKNIVIFGGNSGIGAEMKKLAILNGANVEIASRSYNGVDICDIESVKKYLESVRRNNGEINYIVNTAGVLIKKPIDNHSVKEISDLISVNYLGAVNVSIAAKKFLLESHGMLLNFTSSSYTRGRAYYALYSSANAAIVNFTQAIAEEWEDELIRVNCINPERTATPMRLKNFGIEPKELLLSAHEVAITSLNVLLSDRTGIIVDVRKDGR